MLAKLWRAAFPRRSRLKNVINFKFYFVRRRRARGARLFLFTFYAFRYNLISTNKTETSIDDVNVGVSQQVAKKKKKNQQQKIEKNTDLA